MSTHYLAILAIATLSMSDRRNESGAPVFTLKYLLEVRDIGTLVKTGLRDHDAD